MGNCSSTKNKKKSSTTNRQPVNLAPTIQNNKPTNTITQNIPSQGNNQGVTGRHFPNHYYDNNYNPRNLLNSHVAHNLHDYEVNEEINDSDLRIHNNMPFIRAGCPRCNLSFHNSTLFDIHRSRCPNDSTGILNMMRNLNRILRGDVMTNIQNLINGIIENEENKDNLLWNDWEYILNEKDKIGKWVNLGQITLTKDDLIKISGIEQKLIKFEKYYKKRIWFIRYVYSHILQREDENTTIVVNRENIIEESFNQFSTSTDLDLRKPVHIFFVDEVAQDIGGVYREWYSVIFEKIFSKEESFFKLMFNEHIDYSSYFIPIASDYKYKEFLKYYEFIGKIIGKAILDNITIRVQLNKVLIKHLLDMPLSIDDLRFIDNDYFTSLSSLLDKNIEDDMDIFFTWEIPVAENGQTVEIEIIPNGSNLKLNNNNKYLYVEKVIDLICRKSIEEKLSSFLCGFYSIIPKDLIQIFNIEELEFLISGQHTIDIEDWKNNTTYKGDYNENHPTIKNFWQILSSLKENELLAFFKFCTGCSSIPLDGFHALLGARNIYQKFSIEPTSEINKLIEAKTCFNRIYLPNYDSKEKMEQVIMTIINNDTNFFGRQ